MNILILNWKDKKNPTSGGAEIVTHEHAKAWVQAGHHVTWFTSYFPKAKRKEVLEGINIVRKGSYISVYLFAPLFYLFSHTSYDVVIDEIHGIPFLTPLYIRKPKIAFIHEVAGEIWDYMYSFPFNILGKVIESIYPIFYKNVFFWTDAKITIKDLERKGIPRKNCIAIPCPVTNRSVSKLPTKNKQTILIYVSRLVKMKGVEDIIQAFRQIKYKIPDAKLWIVGTGSIQYTSQLQKRISDLNLSKEVVFYGFVSNRKKLYLMKKAHLLLHASVKEGWGLVVLEAASQGTPSVVYNSGSLNEVVKHNETGLVVKQNTPNSLADTTLKLLSNKKLYKKFQKKGLEWVKSLTWKEETNKSMQLLLHVKQSFDK